MFERGMKDRERSSPGYTRTERPVDPTRQVVGQGASRPGQTRGKREEWKSRRQQPEKLDIQKQRASRIDRKLQRQEEMQARAPEQARHCCLVPHDSVSSIPLVEHHCLNTSNKD